MENIEKFEINGVAVHIGTIDSTADLIVAKVEECVKNNLKSILGLATGSTPIPVYKKLVEGYKNRGISYSGVATFNLDEYLGLPENSPYSYKKYMDGNLFNKTDFSPKNINIPAQNVSEEGLDEYVKEYSAKIAKFGIDMQILGIGRNGHIGFNEPPADPNKGTHVVDLDKKTREDAAVDTFGELDNVPVQAITMGIKDILSAREIILMAYGGRKTEIVQKMLEGPITTHIPASLLRQEKEKLSVYLDKESAKNLFPMKFRGRESSILEWTEKEKRETLIQVALDFKTPISSLIISDFEKYKLNVSEEELKIVKLEVISFLKNLIDKIKSREKMEKMGKVSLFSPHPDDDVISAGGITMNYPNDIFTSLTMTSGKNGVKKGELNTRKKETIAALEKSGKSRENIEFMDLPFYEAEGRKVSKRDVNKVAEYLNKNNSDTLFLADDLFDPSMTHAKCREIILEAAKEAGFSGDIYGYRGAWDKYDLWEADFAIPLSEEAVVVNITAIKEHKSQLNPKHGGADVREFYERTRDKYIENAAQVNLLLGKKAIKYLDLYKKF